MRIIKGAQTESRENAKGRLVDVARRRTATVKRGPLKLCSYNDDDDDDAPSQNAP